MTKGRNHRKQILEVTFDAGTNTDPKAIKAEIIQFYKSLMGSTQTLSAVNKITMRKGPIPTHSQPKLLGHG